MIIVKITAMLAVLLVVAWKVVELHFSQHQLELDRMIRTDKFPLWYMVLVVLSLVEVVLIVVSVFWFLFLR